MIFHVDANSFYASCERLFRPDLYSKPIAVLSNNDGIVIALNKECKDLGFKRGDVFFKKKDEMHMKGVYVFSSNYTLYADISMRLNLLYHRMAGEVEVYSIDESFLFFPDWPPSQLIETGVQIKKAALAETGIPVSVGIAPTKTLAKMCNKLAKNTGGVCCWASLDNDAELKKYRAGDIWGIGYAKSQLLARYNIHTAYDLKKYPLHLAKKHLTVTGMRTVQELNGIPALDRTERESHKNICSSKSFADPVYRLDELKTALADYTIEAVKRMREEKAACRLVSVYLMTNPYSEAGGQYYNGEAAEFPRKTSYLPDILGTAVMLLERLFKSGYPYRKVMITLLALEKDGEEQLDFFDDASSRAKQQALMSAFDEVNTKYGRGTLYPLMRKDTADKQQWKMKRDFLSPEYTTNIEQIPAVY